VGTACWQQFMFGAHVFLKLVHARKYTHIHLKEHYFIDPVLCNCHHSVQLISTHGFCIYISHSVLYKSLSRTKQSITARMIGRFIPHSALHAVILVVHNIWLGVHKTLHVRTAKQVDLIYLRLSMDMLAVWCPATL
jgi:hypothetical protein